MSNPWPIAPRTRSTAAIANSLTAAAERKAPPECPAGLFCWSLRGVSRARLSRTGCARLILQIVAGVGVHSVARRSDRRQRIGVDRGFDPLGELGGMLLGRAVRQDQRFLDLALSRPQRGVARRGGDAQPVHARAGSGGDESTDDHILLQTLEGVD